MKKVTFLFVTLLSLLMFNCSTEEASVEEQNLDPNFRVSVSNKKQTNTGGREVEGTVCLETALIAGQNYNIGTVTASVTEDTIIITYTITDNNWSIEATHLSIGNCDDQEIPTTGSGNPKVGKFEHGEENLGGAVEVSYSINSGVLEDMYCFAAHAEVVGPDGEETAWAGGTNDFGGGGGRVANSSSQYGYTVKEFGGRSWATYIEAFQWACGF